MRAERHSGVAGFVLSCYRFWFSSRVRSVVSLLVIASAGGGFWAVGHYFGVWWQAAFALPAVAVGLLGGTLILWTEGRK